VVPAEVPRIGDAAIGFASVAFAVATTVLVALACGLAPALRASRPRVTWLREGGRGATRQRNWSRDGLVVAQTALALVLLIGSGLLVRSYANLNGVDRGYDIEDIFTFQFAPEQPALATGPSAAQFLLDFMDRVRALPGVQAVGVVENVPLDEGTATSRFRPEGGAPGAGSRLSYTFSGGDHFKALGVKVLAGRPFSKEDAIGILGNVVISKSAAAALWPDQDPIGKRLQRDGWTTWETVVGVVDDVTQLNFRDRPDATVYLPMTGHTPTQYRLTSPGIVVRTSRADAIASEIRAIVKQVAPEAPMYRAYTMEFLARRATGSLSVTMLALGLVSAMALILGALGVYGVLSYVVAQRTPEIGVRMALGAAPRGVRWMVVGQGLKVVALGTALGVGVAVLASKTLGSLLFGVESLDVLTFVAMSTLMLVIGVLASYLPARRASNVDPIQSLR
jgi:putative ABC transport system permease protein